jgi:hypothetical protein
VAFATRAILEVGHVRPVPKRSIVRAEAAVPGFQVQSRELSAVHMDQRDVVAGFQINIRLRVDAGPLKIA